MDYSKFLTLSPMSSIVAGHLYMAAGLKPVVKASRLRGHLRLLSATTEDKACRLVQQSLNRKDKNDRFLATIVDRGMLDMDNQKLLECLRLCQDSTPKIPIILLSPFGRHLQDHMKELNIDFGAQVSKPVKSSHLLNAILNIAQNSESRHSDEAGAAASPSESDDIEPVSPGAKRWAKRLKSATGSNTTLTMDMETGKRYPLKLLVAEDNKMNQKVMIKLLQRHGYSADIVGNGLEAVDAASRTSYDAVLMDCFMPEMDGLEATTRIRQRVQPCPVIVAVTAAALEEERQACAAAGMHMYMSKPIKSEALINTLYKCWQVKNREVTLESLHSSPYSRVVRLGRTIE